MPPEFLTELLKNERLSLKTLHSCDAAAHGCSFVRVFLLCDYVCSVEMSSSALKAQAGLKPRAENRYSFTRDISVCVYI